MIQRFVDAYMKHKDSLRAKFSEAHPGAYGDILKEVLNVISLECEDYDDPDINRITEIDYGDYQGSILFVIASRDYQPSVYYYVMVFYGSCSGCDTLQAIREYSDDPPTDDQVDQYMTLALHMVQKLKKLQPAYDEIV